MDLHKYQPQAAFSQKHLTSLWDYTADEIYQLLSTALRVKALNKAHTVYQPLKGKQLAMLFSKPSARTRTSFEVGMSQLGGHALYIDEPKEVGIGKRESTYDIANVFSRFVDGIMIRTFSQDWVQDLAKYGQVPVINGLSDMYHPCQVLADMLTVYEHFGTFENLTLAYIGDGNNMTHSLMLICAKLGVNMRIACPDGYGPDVQITQKALADVAATNARITLCSDPYEAAASANIVYTDTWASMGAEHEAEQRAVVFKPYQVNAALMQAADPKAIFLHCLPAHRNSEVTDEVIDSPQSLVFDQAENRLHAQKAVMVHLMGD